jgi:AcrR family transcriptional regulator
MTDTKQKILDAAERLFAEQGYSATSLRQIIAEAGVNLASVHYHFGSKEELLYELILRKAAPVNEKRMEMLDRCEALYAPHPVPPEVVLEAFLSPMAEAAERNRQFVRVMGRLYGDGLLPAIVERIFHTVATRFAEMLRRSLPHLPDEEFAWRVRFMKGAMAHAMCGHGMDGDFLSRVDHLARFLVGGFLAPAAQTVEVDQPVEVER